MLLSVFLTDIDQFSEFFHFIYNFIRQNTDSTRENTR